MKGGEFDTVKDMIANDIPLPPKYKDHPLHHNWEGSRECHIKPISFSCIRLRVKTCSFSKGLGVMQKFSDFDYILRRFSPDGNNSALSCIYSGLDDSNLL